MARIHGIWGIAQMARKDAKYGSMLPMLLGDRDLEIQAQAAKMIGDIRLEGAFSSDKMVVSKVSKALLPKKKF